MNEFSTFLSGVADAEIDLRSGLIYAGGPTEKPVVATLDYLVNEFRHRLACSDEYLAGYLSVFFDPSRK